MCLLLSPLTLPCAQTQLHAVLHNSEALPEQLARVLCSVFPELAAALPSADGADDKKDPWEKQLVEHSFFRVLGACAAAQRPQAQLTPPPDTLLSDAIQARQPLMLRSGAHVLRALDCALVLCEACVPGLRHRCLF